MRSILKTLLCLLTAICLLSVLAACDAPKTSTAQGSSAEPQATNAPAAEAPATEAPTAEPAAATEAPTAEPAVTEETAEFKTMGDVFVYESPNNGCNETKYVYVFEKDGVFYRAVAELPADVSETIWALDFFDEKYSEKLQEAIAPLPIAELENLTERIPAQTELDALIGKTGQELKDEGWTISAWQLDDMEFTLNHGPFAYTVFMEGDYVPNENYDFDEDADFAPLKVKSVTYCGIGDATGDVLDADMEAEF